MPNGSQVSLSFIVGQEGGDTELFWQFPKFYDPAVGTNISSDNVNYYYPGPQNYNESNLGQSVASGDRDYYLLGANVLSAPPIELGELNFNFTLPVPYPVTSDVNSTGAWSLTYSVLPPPMLYPTNKNGQLSLTWSNVSFTLQESPRIDSTNWVSLTSNSPAVFTFPSQTNVFFRLKR